MGAVDLKIKHKAEHILESNDKQFVSKAEKDKWNNCQGGSGDVDLSNYYTKDQVDAEISKVKALMAGVKFPIETVDWTAENSKFKYVLAHGFDIPLESTSVTFYNEQNENVMLDYTYIDSNTIHVFSNERVKIVVVIKQIVELEVQVDLSNYYTKQQTDSQIQTKVDDLVGAAPDTLDTLKELSDALGNDANFSTTVTNLIAEKAPKVHKHKVEDIEGIEDIGGFETDWGLIPETLDQEIGPLPEYHKDICPYWILSKDSNVNYPRYTLLRLESKDIIFSSSYKMMGDCKFSYQYRHNSPSWQLDSSYGDPNQTKYSRFPFSLKEDGGHSPIYSNFRIKKNENEYWNDFPAIEDAPNPRIDVSMTTGSTRAISDFIGVEGQVVYDKNKKTIVAMDGSTSGGTPLAKEVHTHNYSDLQGAPPAVDLTAYYNKTEIDTKHQQLFQSVSSGKTLLETAITDKGGTVSKVGSIATFEELKTGIEGITTEAPPKYNADKLKEFSICSGITLLSAIGVKPKTEFMHKDLGLKAFDAVKSTLEFNIDGSFISYGSMSSLDKFKYWTGEFKTTANTIAKVMEFINTIPSSSISITEKVIIPHNDKLLECSVRPDGSPTKEFSERFEVKGSNEFIVQTDTLTNTYNREYKFTPLALNGPNIFTIWVGQFSGSMTSNIQFSWNGILHNTPNLYNGYTGVKFINKSNSEVYKIVSFTIPYDATVTADVNIELIKDKIPEKSIVNVENNNLVYTTDVTWNIILSSNIVITKGEIHVCREEGKDKLLNVIISKVPSLDGVLTLDSPLSLYAHYMMMIGPMNLTIDEITKPFTVNIRQSHMINLSFPSIVDNIEIINNQPIVSTPIEMYQQDQITIRKSSKLQLSINNLYDKFEWRTQ